MITEEDLWEEVCDAWGLARIVNEEFAIARLVTIVRAASTRMSSDQRG
jgi:hypothetical protein